MLRLLADEHACGPGVVEMDVGEQQVRHVLQREPVLGQPCLQLGHAGCGPAVLEGEPVSGLEQVRADDALAPEVPQVEELAQAVVAVERTSAASRSASRSSGDSSPTESRIRLRGG